MPKYEMIKNIRWFKRIDDEWVMNKAIENARTSGTLMEESSSLEAAIRTGFNWASSPQGAKYWDKIVSEL